MNNIPIRDQLAARYEALDLHHQQVFLAKLGEWLTLVGRGYYDTEDGVSELRAVNEAMHRVLGQLQRMLDSNKHRYPDDVFANVLVDQFQALKLDPATIFRFFE
jgi:hypothetical protein